MGTGEHLGLGGAPAFTPEDIPFGVGDAARAVQAAEFIIRRVQFGDMRVNSETLSTTIRNDETDDCETDGCPDPSEEQPTECYCDHTENDCGDQTADDDLC